jgi:crotonobetainyl-CoA:carnitine CoA-transferase CaiB-like acyl-CoA transferase
MTEDAAQRLLETIWSATGGDPDLLEHVKLKGHTALPSVYDVTGLATASVAAAVLAAAEFGAARSGSAVPPVRVHRSDASAAFRSEALLEPLGWELPAVWDPLAGDYRTADGWIRLHTNYRHHRAAALVALGLRADPDRDDVAAAVARREGDELETAVVAAGGCAAVMRTRKQWARHPHGSVALAEPVLRLDRVALPATDVPAAGDPPPPGRPLDGLRVLDLTRVIAGPVATRTLAAWGAHVLRIDPPGFAEVPALLPDMTVGKSCAALDLSDEADRARFEALVARADVLVHGLRPGALAGLGYDAGALRAANPGLVIAGHDAYGWDGPWAGRRGFDSLVQMSVGICAAGASAAGVDRPVPLPAQALDHATGYLVAAAVCRALTTRRAGGGTLDVRASLVGTANLLTAHEYPGDADGQVTEVDLTDRRVERPTAWGPVLAVRPPGSIDGEHGRWDLPAGALGADQARFGPREPAATP